MISFVWMSNYPFLAGTGGSENYTAGQIRELRKRGINANIITMGFGKNDGRDDFPDIPFNDISNLAELQNIDATLVFIAYPYPTKTMHPAYTIMHYPLSLCDSRQQLFTDEATDKKLIAPSKYAAKLWAQHFGKPVSQVPVAYPFADIEFSKVNIPKRTNKKIKMLFAGRLTPDKGVYILLAALHFKIVRDLNLEITATTACDHSQEGQIVKKLFEAHPEINLIPARKNPAKMAELFAENDVVVMPSTAQSWYETFGIVSVEAQHTGCRVVASRSGGLPETDCGGLVLVEPDNPFKLAEGIVEAVRLGRLNTKERTIAIKKFTIHESVDQLLAVLGQQPIELEIKRI